MRQRSQKTDSRRELFKEGLAKRTEESFNRKEDTGRFGSFIKEEFQDNLWKCKEGTHTIDIVPYLTGGFDPHVKKNEPAYVWDGWVHTNIGPNEDMIICLARTFKSRKDLDIGGECPICEDYREKKKSGDYDDAQLKHLIPKRRTIYNIINYDNKEEEAKGVQQWEVSYHLIEKFISELAKNPRTGGTIPFPHPDKDLGRTIIFKREGAGPDNTKYIGHRFENRDYDISDEELNAARALDEIVRIPTYEEAENLHFGKKGMARRSSEGDEPEEREGKHEEVEGRVPDGRCPHGLTFGVSIESKPVCATCKVFDECAIEEERAKKVAEERKLTESSRGSRLRRG